MWYYQIYNRQKYLLHVRGRFAYLFSCQMKSVYTDRFFIVFSVCGFSLEIRSFMGDPMLFLWISYGFLPCFFNLLNFFYCWHYDSLTDVPNFLTLCPLHPPLPSPHCSLCLWAMRIFDCCYFLLILCSASITCNEQKNICGKTVEMAF